MSRHWRLFEEKGGHLHTLFHGWHKSRRLPVGEWLEAESKDVFDGSRGTSYLSGWHVFAHESGLEYLERFTAERRLVAVEVEVKGSLRPKVTNPDILLAQWMRIPPDAERRVVKDG